MSTNIVGRGWKKILPVLLLIVCGFVVDSQPTQAYTSTYYISVSAQSGWVNTGVTVYNGYSYTVSANSSNGWRTRPDYPYVNANGYSFTNGCSVITGSDPTGYTAYHGGLIAKRDSGGTPYYVGLSRSFTPSGSGSLWLSINDSGKSGCSLSDNGGTIQVTITVNEPDSLHCVTLYARTSSGSGISNVTISNGSQSGTTDGSGTAIICGVPFGVKGFSASKSGYSFSPGSVSMVVPQNATYVFTGSPTTFSTYQCIKTSGGAGISGVTVSVSANSSTWIGASTDSNGCFSINNLPMPSATLYFAKTGWTFSPSSLTVNSAGASYVIIGTPNATQALFYVRDQNGAALSGATVTSNSGQSGTSDSNGAAYINGVPNGTWTFSVSKSGYYFATSSLTVPMPQVATYAFNGQQILTSASGTVKTSGGQGISGVVVSVSPACNQSPSATTDANGTFTVSGLSGSSTTLYYCKAEWSFNPSSSNVPLLGNPSNLSVIGTPAPIVLTNWTKVPDGSTNTKGRPIAWCTLIPRPGQSTVANCTFTIALNAVKKAESTVVVYQANTVPQLTEAAYTMCQMARSAVQGSLFTSAPTPTAVTLSDVHHNNPLIVTNESGSTKVTLSSPSTVCDRYKDPDVPKDAVFLYGIQNTVLVIDAALGGASSKQQRAEDGLSIFDPRFTPENHAGRSDVTTALNDSGRLVWLPRYTTGPIESKPINEDISVIRSQLLQMFAARPGASFDLYGHSLGGVILSFAVSGSDLAAASIRNANQIRSLTTLNSPLEGAEIATEDGCSFFVSWGLMVGNCRYFPDTTTVADQAFHDLRRMEEDPSLSVVYSGLNFPVINLAGSYIQNEGNLLGGAYTFAQNAGLAGDHGALERTLGPYLVGKITDQTPAGQIVAVFGDSTTYLVTGSYMAPYRANDGAVARNRALASGATWWCDTTDMHVKLPDSIDAGSRGVYETGSAAMPVLFSIADGYINQLGTLYGCTGPTANPPTPVPLPTVTPTATPQPPTSVPTATPGGSNTATPVPPTSTPTQPAPTATSTVPSGQSIISFTLIDADTDQPIPGYDPISAGMTINLNSLSTRNLNIRANTNPGTVGSVRFGFDGNENYQTETNAPYALASDEGGNYNNWTPSVGSHTVSATPFTEAGGNGAAGTALSLTFTVIDEASTPTPGPQSVESFTLINADNDQPIAGYDPIEPNMTINMMLLPTGNLNIRANTSPSTVGSVVFNFDGNANYRTETNAPYALGSDENGDYLGWSPGLGTHTVIATPYSQAGGSGNAGAPLMLTFTVIDEEPQSVVSFTLIDAETDQAIPGYDPILAGMTINLDELPTRNLNIRAHTNPSTVGSVRFGFDGNENYQTETNSPYALASDENGDYNAWTPAQGSHTITATPFTEAGATGTAGVPLSLTFEVVENATAAGTQVQSVYLPLITR